MRKLLKSGERGSALVEMSLVLPILVSLFIGVWQFGYSFFLYNELQQAVRDGARYASLATYDSSSTTPSSAYASAVKNVVVYGNPAGGTTPVVPNLSTAKVAVSIGFRNGVPVTTTVSIVNYSLKVYLASVNLTNKPSTVFPYVGTYAPPVI